MNTPGLMSMVGKQDLEKEFDAEVSKNLARIRNDPRLPELNKQLDGMIEVAEERSKPNIITYSQFMPYVALFGKSDRTGIDPDTLASRMKLFDRYVKDVINPQQITIILSDDRTRCVGAHDRILIKLASASASDDVASLTGMIITNQERGRPEDAGRIMDALGTQFVMANHASLNKENTIKTYMDTMLITVIQKKLREALERGEVGFAYDPTALKTETSPDSTLDDVSQDIDPDSDDTILL